MTDTTDELHPAPAPAPVPAPVPAAFTGPAVGSPSEVLVAVAGVVAGLRDRLWAAQSPSELVASVVAVEGLRSVLDAVLLAVVAEVDATGAARVAGWGSTRDFLTAVSGDRKGAGKALTRLAHAVTGDRPALGEALVRGRVSRAQALVVLDAVERLPVAPGLRDAAEALLLDEAETRDASDLVRAGRHVVERLDPDGDAAREERALSRVERAAHLRRFLSITEDGLGGVRVSGRGTVEDAAWITAVLRPLAAPVSTGDPATGTVPGACGGTLVDRPGACGVGGCAHDGRDPRDGGVRWWDALVEAARRLATADLLPDSHTVPPRVTITVDHDTLTTRLAERAHTTDEPADHPTARTSGAATIGDGQPLSVGAVRRLACDAEVLPVVLGTASQVLDVGRTHRLVTPGIWHALVTRDQHCAFPGCTRPPIACDAHHLVHWADGGPTSLANLVLLCRHHHTHLHQTPWHVRLNPHDHRPEFLPPPELDPHRTPIRSRQPRPPLRT